MRTYLSLEAALEAFAARSAAALDAEAAAAVRPILDDVERRGDAAVLELGERFDGVRPPALAVDPADIDAAESELDPELTDAIRLAERRVRRYYERQPASGFLAQEPDALLAQLVRPLRRVGCYVPGGSAPLFSSLIMTAVPARVAGVPEIAVATPPRPDGGVAPEIRFTAALLGIREIYRTGGAQAIAALAYGTESVPPVDKVVGPGNRYVVAAKREVYGRVGVESLPGPTETLVLADDSADVRHVVADLLAQAEHLDAQPVLVTPSRRLAEAVERALPEAIDRLPTAAAARQSVVERGIVVIVQDVREGIQAANAYAPEHLCLLVEDPWSWVSEVRNAGGLFVGAHSMEALGDYLAGPSHVMPTSGTARYASFVNLRDFQKVIPLVAFGGQAVAEIGPAAARLARAEGLEAHAQAILARLGGD
ncbi:MAG: histidinol dehydrogenase [Deinococcales bacterium]